MDGSKDLRERLAALTPEQRALLEPDIVFPPSPRAASTENDGGAPFAMTDIQQAYWAGRHTDFALGGVATHSYAEFDSDGLDLVRLSSAWNRLIARHPMLRAVFAADGTQRVLESVPGYEIVTEDLRELPPAAQEARLQHHRQRMSHQVLAAERWPLFEIRASLLTGGRCRIHLSFDALIADLTSRQLVMREWGELYRDTTVDLPQPGMRFRDFAHDKAAARGTGAHLRARDYWLARALPPAPELPRQQDLGPAPLFTRRTLRAAREPLEHVARGFGTTLNVLLLTAYGDVLRLWGGGSSFTLNLTLFDRPNAARDVVGDFTALTMLEVEAPEDRPLGERARRLQEQLWRDLDHRAFGGVAVLREMARREGLPRAAMPVVFTSAIDAPGDGNDTSWLGAEVYGVSQTPQVWIDLVAVAAGSDLMLQFNAVDGLFLPDVTERLFAALSRHLGLLADGTFVADTNWRNIADILMPSDMRAVREIANGTAGPEPSGLLHTIWKDHLRRAPCHPAVVSPGRTLSYGELATLSAGVGRRLRALGAQPNLLIAVVMNKGWEQIVAVLGVLESGAAYLPIDPAVPAARLHHLLKDADARIVLTQASLQEQLTWPDGVEILRVEEAAYADCEPLEPAQRPDDIAYVIYTSGSTGVPKGVAIDHRGALNTILDINARFAVGAEDRVLALSALSFDLSVYDIFGPLSAGGTIVLPAPSGARDPAHWLDLVRRHGVTLWNSVPALMELFVDQVRQTSAAGLEGLRLALLSGDWIPVALPAAMRDAGIPAKCMSLGGATEASIWSIAYEITDGDGTRARIPYGKPLRNQTMRVLAPGWIDCPDWVSGEIYIGGMGLARGYWNDPAKTAAAFVIDPQTGKRFYRTGDRGRYLPDGNIEFLGRDDNQVKLHGFRIELGEIEAALHDHPDVGAAAVILRGTNGGTRALAAYVTPRSAISPEAGTLTAYLHTKLPAYMIPSSISVLTELPLTANGKLDRRALTDREAPRALPASTTPDDGRVAAIVRAVSPAVIPAIDSDLLALGLNSIDLIRIVNALDVELGFRPSIDAIYASPTLRWLTTNYAEHLQRNGATADRDDQQPGETVEPGEIILEPEVTMVRFGPAPLFVFHGSGGRTLFLHAMARHMPSAIGLCGVDAVPREEPQGETRMPLRERYLAALRRARPHGPYRIGGYSAGCLVAADVAAALEAAGERVECLVLIDPVMPPEAQSKQAPDPSPTDRELRRLRIAELAGISPRDPQFPYVEQVDRDFASFLSDYAPRAVSCRTLVLYGTQGDLAPAPATLKMWAALAPNGMGMEALDCDHNGILREPHVGEAAKAIARWLASER
jgi:amino acid adenylation domain-containing protein